MAIILQTVESNKKQNNMFGNLFWWSPVSPTDCDIIISGGVPTDLIDYIIVANPFS